jgi:ribonuclease J
MVVVVLPVSSHDNRLLCEPEIVTRGFVYVKESEELLQELRNVAYDTVEAMSNRKRKDDNEILRAVRSAVSSYLFKQTRRSPMVIPMVTRI